MEKDGLDYLFEFLDAYDFSSESKEIQEENKTIINVLHCWSDFREN